MIVGIPTLDEIRAEIDDKIDTNGVAAITGAVLNAVLNLMLTQNQKPRVVLPSKTLTIPLESEHHQAQDFWNKGTIDIQGGISDSNYGFGLPVTRYGILRVDGVLHNEGIIVNNGIIIS
jgi:hypothetical protein